MFTRRQALTGGLAGLLLPFPAQAAVPDLILYNDDREPERLSQHFGQPLLLNFWTSYCNPCIKEMPELNKLRRKHNILGLMCIGKDFVSSTRELRLYEERKHLAKFPNRILTSAERQRYTNGPMQQTVLEEGPFAYPSFALLDAQGNHIHSQIGSILDEENKARLYQALGL